MHKALAILILLALAGVCVATTERVWVLTVPEGTTTADLGGVDTTASYTYSDGTTQSFDNVIIRGDLDLQGSLTSSSNDMAVSFMGYPKVTLTTNMVTASGTATLMPVSSFTNAFDADITTWTATATNGSAENAYYYIDLGDNYVGYMLINFYGTNANANASSVEVCASHFADPQQGGTDAAAYLRNWVGGLVSAGATNQMVATVPMVGRYAYVQFSTTTSAGLEYKIADWSMYGTTTDYRNMGGF